MEHPKVDVLALKAIDDGCAVRIKARLRTFDLDVVVVDGIFKGDANDGCAWFVIRVEVKWTRTAEARIHFIDQRVYGVQGVFVDCAGLYKGVAEEGVWPLSR